MIGHSRLTSTDTPTGTLYSKCKAHVKSSFRYCQMRQWPDTPPLQLLSLDSGESVSFQKRTAREVILQNPYAACELAF
ncbi:hypothetical protein LI328DRAFT_137313 [Trichoderma asperelloides]|nr:hypothetical protein LI328DRAFT_137313 [Trichoderma asperelloides]